MGSGLSDVTRLSRIVREECIMGKAGRWLRSGVPILLVGGLLMSMTACKQEGTPSSVPSQGDGSSVAASPIDVPDLPENKMLVTSPGESDFLIAENGTAKTTIVIPADPSDKVRAAAEDLQSHLNDITGTASWSGRPNRRRRWGSNSRPAIRKMNGSFLSGTRIMWRFLETTTAISAEPRWL